MTVNTHFAPRKAAKSAVPAKALARFFAIASLFLLLTAAGCSLHSPYTAPVKPTGPATGSSICETARSGIGVRYKAGGTTPATGFDCSGFVCWTFAQHGIDLPRTSKEQAKLGTKISKDQLRPGDLVIFRIASRTGTHSGIYSGNGNFIHSPSSGKTVCEESMNAAYWKSRFLTARRLPQVTQ